MDNKRINKGVSGYSLQGMSGLIGHSGNSIYYSSIESLPEIKDAIINKKPLSNNPALQNDEVAYSSNDFVITPNGRLYCIRIIDESHVTTEFLGDIIISQKREIETEHIPPEKIYLKAPNSNFNPATDSSNLINTYNYHDGENFQSPLYRHIVDSGRYYFAGIKILVDTAVNISATFNGTPNTYKTIKFLQRLSQDQNCEYIKLTFLFKSGYSLEIFIKGAPGDGSGKWYTDSNWNSGYILVDNRYVYYQGVDPSTYTLLKPTYINENIAYGRDIAMENLVNIAFDNEMNNPPVTTYLEYFYKGKNYKVKAEYV